MQNVPTPEEILTLLAPLDQLDRKVLGGLLALMIAEPTRVRDQEWMAEKFIHVTVVAHGFDDQAEATTDDVTLVQAYAQARMPDLVLAAAKLFVRVAEDLRARPEKPSFEDARALVRGYLERGATG